ncbi:MAG: ABC transporter permease [Lacisediminimonas sp.]|nr:ABC transporter permease [Lacisediminimonas sp.]
MTEAVNKMPATRRLPARFSRLLDRLARYGILLLLVAAWEAIVRGFNVSPLTFAKPSDIAVAIMRGMERGLYWEHLGVTVFEMVVGFIIGSSLGFVLGVVVSEFGRLGKLLFPYLVAVQSLPKVAVAPLIIMWFGFGLESKIFVVALITFFPVLINTLSGLSIVDSARIDLMRVILASRWQTFIYVRLPSAAPTIFAGLNVAVVLALTGAIVAEFVGAQRGLGVLVLQAQANLDTAGMFAILIFLASIGLAANLGIRTLERRVVYWAQRRDSEP